MARRAVTHKVLSKMISIPPVPEVISPKIKIIGTTRLKPQEGKAIKEMMNESIDRIQKNYIPNITSFVCHLKKYDLAGAREKSSIHLKLITPAMIFNADAADFNLSTAVGWAIKALEKELLKFKEKIRVSQGSFKGKGRREISAERQLEVARAEKMRTLKVRGERRRLGKVFPPRVKR